MCTSSSKLQNAVYYMAMGDSYGFPYEGMSAKLIDRIGPAGPAPLRAEGSPLTDSIVTDDTMHFLFTIRALRSAGMAHAQGSAGWQKAVMRAPAIGILLAQDEHARRTASDISTGLTHTHPMAFYAARAMAEIAAELARSGIGRHDIHERLCAILRREMEMMVIELSQSDKLALGKFIASIESIPQMSETAFVEQHFPKGVTGFSLDTLKFCILQLCCAKNLNDVMVRAVRCGGDTDSSAGIRAAVYALTYPAAEWPEADNLLARLSAPYHIRCGYSLVEWITGIWHLHRYAYALR